VGRRDRERARRRHAIEKARREAGAEAEPKPAPAAGRRPASTRPGGNRRPAGGSPKSREELRAAYRAQFDRKGVVGDVDVRGRVRSRAMLLHPKITRRALFVCLPIAILGLFQPRLLLLTWVAYGIAFLGLADLARTKAQAAFMVVLSGLAFTFAVAQLIQQLQAA
jgi:hypothetical protein